ncbi:MAG TPA: ribokinase [Thermoclostridium sp.]|nr:ribokinase [Thermoclostridium sp.]
MKYKPRILVVGSYVMDMIVKTNKIPDEGETVIDGISFSTAAGGKGANQAVQAARLGANVTMVGRVGEDFFGSELIKSANESGIDTKYTSRDKEVSSAVGNVLLEVKQGQKVKNRIIVVPGANMRITVKDIEPIKIIIGDFDIVMLQLEIPTEVNEAVASYAYEKGVPVMLNPAPSALLSDRLLSKLTYISPNEHEASDITGIEIRMINNKPDMDDVMRIASKLLLKVKNVIITLGSNGVVFMNKEKFIYRPCVDIVKVIDPTAAGDSFVASFCTSISSGMSEEEAIDFANHAAALTVSRTGAQPSLPYFKEVINVMNESRRDAMNEK